MRTALLWVITQQVVVITRQHLGQPISPIFMGQKSKTAKVNTLHLPLVFDTTELDDHASGYNVMYLSQKSKQHINEH